MLTIGAVLIISLVGLCTPLILWVISDRRERKRFIKEYRELLRKDKREQESTKVFFKLSSVIADAAIKNLPPDATQDQIKEEVDKQFQLLTAALEEPTPGAKGRRIMQELNRL